VRWWVVAVWRVLNGPCCDTGLHCGARNVASGGDLHRFGGMLVAGLIAITGRLLTTAGVGTGSTAPAATLRSRPRCGGCVFGEVRYGPRVHPPSRTERIG